MVQLFNKTPPPSQIALKTRFAPSPTGHLHLGHVLSAYWVFNSAKQLGAEVIVRLEDHDQGRYKKEYEESILEDLAWLDISIAIRKFLIKERSLNTMENS